jgi:hypothetical protein
MPLNSFLRALKPAAGIGTDGNRPGRRVSKDGGSFPE